MEAYLENIKTPCYVVDKRLIEKNLKILDGVQKSTGCEILLALKGFSMYEFFSQIGEVLAGVTASSLFEARLGHEEMAKQVHIYSPAYRDDNFSDIMDCCDHIIFNSFAQLDKYKDTVVKQNKHISIGIRVNPEYSEVDVEMYDPCSVNSRLGVKLSEFKPDELEGVEGIHFHAMCEQNSDTLERIIEVFEDKFGEYLYDMKWVNFGGGHHITRDDYDIDRLVRIIRYIKNKYDIEVYIEPGEAIALNTGYLATRVLDIIPDSINNVIVDASAACHMPDVLEMPYRPEIIGAGKLDENRYNYRLGGPSCLAGDIIGDYSFKKPLKIGDVIILCDMAHYTMVKNNMFNGINLPAIATLDDDGIKVVKEFFYEDYKSRL